MPPFRFVLPISTLMVLGLWWSVNSNPTPVPLRDGYVTDYITPAANFSLDQLLGRWYMAEHVSSAFAPNELKKLCLTLNFYYNDNGTLVVAPISLLDGNAFHPTYTLPVSENGIWEMKRYGVLINSHAVVHVDGRFLVVGSCNSGDVKDCVAFVMVRHVEDADRPGDMEAMHGRVASAGVDATDGGFVKVIEPCRQNGTQNSISGVARIGNQTSPSVSSNN